MVPRSAARVRSASRLNKGMMCGMVPRFAARVRSAARLNKGMSAVFALAQPHGACGRVVAGDGVEEERFDVEKGGQDRHLPGPNGEEGGRREGKRRNPMEEKQNIFEAAEGNESRIGTACQAPRKTVLAKARKAPESGERGEIRSP